MIWNNGFLFSKFSNILKQFKVLMASWLAFANTNLKCTHYGIFFDKTRTHYIVFSLKYIADIEHNFEMEQIPGKVKNNNNHFRLFHQENDREIFCCTCNSNTLYIVDNFDDRMTSIQRNHAYIQNGRRISTSSAIDSWELWLNW